MAARHGVTVRNLFEEMIDQARSEELAPARPYAADVSGGEASVGVPPTTASIGTPPLPGLARRPCGPSGRGGGCRRLAPRVLVVAPRPNPRRPGILFRPAPAVGDAGQGAGCGRPHTRPTSSRRSLRPRRAARPPEVPATMVPESRLRHPVCTATQEEPLAAPRAIVVRSEREASRRSEWAAPEVTTGTTLHAASGPNNVGDAAAAAAEAYLEPSSTWNQRPRC